MNRAFAAVALAFVATLIVQGTAHAAPPATKDEVRRAVSQIEFPAYDIKRLVAATRLDLNRDGRIDAADVKAAVASPGPGPGPGHTSEPMSPREIAVLATAASSPETAENKMVAAAHLYVLVLVDVARAMGHTVQGLGTPGTAGGLPGICASEEIADAFPPGSAAYNLLDHYVEFVQCGTPLACAYAPNGERGLALVYKRGAYHDPQLSLVCLENLGIYDSETGERVAGNEGKLTGKYLETDVRSCDELFSSTCATWSNIPVFEMPSNDFRILPSGTSVASQREAIVWASEAHIYYYITDYRNRFLTDEFIDSLSLSEQVAVNLKNRQFRPDLSAPSIPPEDHRYAKPSARVREVFFWDGYTHTSYLNRYDTALRTRGPLEPYASLPPLSNAFDPEAFVGDYAGLAANWIFASNQGWQDMSFWWDGLWWNNILPALEDGLNLWTAHQISGQTEVYKYFSYAARQWNNLPEQGQCASTNPSQPYYAMPCDKGQNIRNVMMFDETQTDKNGVFPFSWPSATSAPHGPIADDQAGLFFAAVFYDIAYEAGLGAHKTSQLLWKTLSLISNTQQFTMRDFGTTVILASRELWPTDQPPLRTPPVGGNQGLYERDIADVLTSRGIPLYNVSNFKNNLPAAIGPTRRQGVNGFGTSHPDSQPNVISYNVAFSFEDGYTHPDSSAQYVSYQFMRHSKYGPCDKLKVTDGTFSSNGAIWVYNNDGTYYSEIVDRDLNNLVLLAPGRAINWVRERRRCANEAEGFYTEDTRPLGFRVVRAVSNGFSISVDHLSGTTYRVHIVDPSLVRVGPATYQWFVQASDGSEQQYAGHSAEFSVAPDEPFTLRIERTRGAQVDVLELRERANDFGRNSGQAFVVNLVP